MQGAIAMRFLVFLILLLLNTKLFAAEMLYAATDIESVKMAILESLSDRKFTVDQESSNRLILSKEIKGTEGFLNSKINDWDAHSPSNLSLGHPRVELSFFFLKKPEGIKVIVTRATLQPLENGNTRRISDGDEDSGLSQFLAEIKQKISGVPIASEAYNETSADALQSFLNMAPSLNTATNVIWVKSVESAINHQLPSAAVVGVACKDGRVPVIAIGTEIKIKKLWTLMPTPYPLTDVRYYFDTDSSHRNWELFGPSEAGPLASTEAFVDSMIGAKTLKLEFEQDGKDERTVFTFHLNELGIHEKFAALRNTCKNGF
jgi:hypothetical protein